jgi:hypothetical protein
MHEVGNKIECSNSSLCNLFTSACNKSVVAQLGLHPFTICSPTPQGNLWRLAELGFIFGLWAYVT